MLASITSFDVVLFAIALVVFSMFLLPLSVLPAWWVARKARLPVGTFELVGVKLRKSNPMEIVRTTAELHAMGYTEATISQVETMKLSGIDMPRLFAGLTLAQGSNVQLSLHAAQAICLAGRDLEAEVRKFVAANPAKEVRMSVSDVLGGPR